MTLIVLKIMGAIDIGWCWLVLLIILLPVLIFVLIVFVEVLLGTIGALILYLVTSVRKGFYVTISEKQFQVIYADPPWPYDIIRLNTRYVGNHYSTMSIEDICNLNVPSADDAILYLWATAPTIARSY